MSEYETQHVNECGYEAYKRFIDIQYVLDGTEKVCCLPLDRLIEAKPYSERDETAFYASDSQPFEMVIGNGYFTILFPHDGHMPCLCVNKQIQLKK